MKIKELPKIEKREVLNRQCALCGKSIEVVLYSDRTYRGGHYFFKFEDKTEYWECPKCYWGR